MPGKRRGQPLKRGRKKRKENPPLVCVWPHDRPGLGLAFGSGDMSQLGLGDEFRMRERKKPTIIQPLKEVISITTQALHCLALNADGKVFSWGCNDDFALGRSGDEFEPAPVEGLDDVTIVKADAGSSHSIVLGSNGQVYTFGAYRDSSGLIGYDEKERHAKVPRKVEGFDNDTCVDIAAAMDHDLALTASGNIYYWGKSAVGMRASRRHKRTKLQPRRIGIKKPKGWARKPTFSHVFAGGSSNFAVENDEGRLFAWGPNNYGQLGIPQAHEEDLAVLAPTLVEGISNVAQVAAALHHTLILTTDGKVYTMGRGHYGRLGHGDQKDRVSPTLIEELQWDDDKVVSIAAGEAHSLCCTESGKLFSWGNGDLLQLGTGEGDDVLTPTEVTSRQITEYERSVVQVAGGAQHSILVALVNPERDE